MRTLTITLGDLTFDALASGPQDGPLVLLLHGFPQTAASFRRMLPRLGAAGLRAVAVTQRGYSAGARTDAIARYTPAALADDVLHMADALGAERFHVVGHDLGGVIAWQLAGTASARLRSATVLSTPHPRAHASALLRGGQALRSAYVPVFALPAVPQVLLGAGGGIVLRTLLRRSGMTDDVDLAAVERLARAGGLRYAFHWYRALLTGAAASIPAAAVPTTYVWSDGDVALGRTAAERTAAHVIGDYRFEVLAGVSHWIPETAPAAAADLAIDRVLAVERGG